MLGRYVRLVTRWEWETLRPALGALPQISQTFDIDNQLHFSQRIKVIT